MTNYVVYTTLMFQLENYLLQTNKCFRANSTLTPSLESSIFCIYLGLLRFDVANYMITYNDDHQYNKIRILDDCTEVR